MVDNLNDIDERETNLRNLIEYASKKLENKSDVKNWEIFGGISNGTSVKIEKGFLKRSSISESNSLTFRVFGNKGNVGSASITRMSEKHILNSIDNAIKMMRVSLPNPEFKNLAIPAKEYPKIKTPWDPEISKLNVEDLSGIIDQFMAQKKRDERIKSISGGFGYGDIRANIVNSNGINLVDKGTSVSVSMEVFMEEMIGNNKENSSGYDFQTYNEYNSLELQEISDKAYDMALKGLNKENIETNSYPVILSPLAVDLLVCSAIDSGINAEAVHQKRSFLQNKLGEKIGNDLLEIDDNPWLENGIASCSFDDEGSPTKPLKVIEKGTLKSFLHNVYTANLFGVESTGHATHSFNSPIVGISSSNTIVKTGETSLSSMFEEIKKGIYLEYSFDSPNVVTGDFSGLITNGYIIENGEIGKSLKEAMLGTNLLDLYQKIKAVSKESIRKDSNYLPYMLISGLTIAGR